MPSRVASARAEGAGGAAIGPIAILRRYAHGARVLLQGERLYRWKRYKPNPYLAGDAAGERPGLDQTMVDCSQRGMHVISTSLQHFVLSYIDIVGRWRQAVENAS